jgi:hypothetical protein
MSDRKQRKVIGIQCENRGLEKHTKVTKRGVWNMEILQIGI